MASPLYDTIEFMRSFGIFDVVLPFLLVFTVIFGVLEKTKIFGSENKKSRKNLNAMLAFTIGFFVVSMAQVVYVIQTALPWIMMLLIFIIAFMIVYGSTLPELGHKGFNLWKDFGKHRGKFGFGVFIAIIAIVLGSMDMLQGFVNWLFNRVTGPGVGTVILLAVVGIFMWIVLKDPKGANNHDDSDDDSSDDDE